MRMALWALVKRVGGSGEKKREEGRVFIVEGPCSGHEGELREREEVRRPISPYQIGKAATIRGPRSLSSSNRPLPCLMSIFSHFPFKTRASLDPRS